MVEPRLVFASLGTQKTLFALLLAKFSLLRPLLFQPVVNQPATVDQPELSQNVNRDRTASQPLLLFGFNRN